MINFKNDSYSTIIDEKKGCIKSLVQGDKEYVFKESALFTLRFRHKDGSYEDIDTYSMDFLSGFEEKDEAKIVYEAKDKGFSAELGIKFGENIEWRINVKNNTDFVLEHVDFALIVPKDLVADGGRSKVLWGFNEGVLVDNIDNRKDVFGFLEFGYPGVGLMPVFPAIVETQFMAYFDGVHGLYLATHDNEGNMKAIDFCPWDGGIKLYFRILTNSDFGCDFNMGYPFVMQMFSGEWQEAAEIYRRWFEENKAEGFVPISQNDKIPEWYSQSPIVVTYPVRGEHDMDVMEPNKMFPYINGLKHIDYLAQRLNSKIMVLLMHWEGTAPWAPPYVWPPYGGEEELEKYIDALHKEGHLIGLYCSGLGWTTQSHLVKEYNMTEEFRKRDLGKYMCVSPEQELLYSKTCTGIRESYDMCPTEKLCTDTMAEQAKYMIDADIDYIQLLDQNHGGAAYCCYSQNHSHPPVPGKWMTDAVNSIMDKIRSESAKKVLFGCESAAAESFIPNLLFNDNRFNLAYQIGVPVPAYAYIYHEYINNFMGNQVGINWVFDYEKNPENFAMRIAYSFCAGDMLTLVLNEDGKINWNWGKQQLDYLPDNDKIIEFVRIANKFRRDIAPQYLHLGKMIAPLATEVEKYEVTEFNGFTLTLEKVCFSRWQAKDGTWAQFFANYNDEDIDVGVNPKEKCILISEEGGIEFSGASMTIPKNSIVMLSNNLGYEKN